MKRTAKAATTSAVSTQIPGLGKVGDVAATWWAIERVLRWAKNPRINAHVVPKVAASIKRFGFGSPLVCRSDGTLIAGETRWKAAQLLGLAVVPVRVMDHLSDTEAVALGIVDNKLAEAARWHDALVTELVRDELEPAGYGVEELVDGRRLLGRRRARAARTRRAGERTGG